MATISETHWVKKYGPYTDFNVLELGSAHGHSLELRKAAQSKSYTGVDMQAGATVDIVHNMNEPLSIDPVDVVFCFSMLEHCDKPWLVAQNIQKVLKKDGLLLISVPFQWRVHGYPNDYWRFTFNGIKALFTEINWLEKATDPKKIDINSHQGVPILLLVSGRKV
jgi:2-polyprenyl-3-methyl-5-hydroxy-6-metoxy-1,4-benzoquinol methylase